MKKTLTVITILIILIIISFFVYKWIYPDVDIPFFKKKDATTKIEGFNPIGRGSLPVTKQSIGSTTQTTTNNSDIEAVELAKLRKISSTPVGGMYASSTALRYIDRGLGHIYEIGATSTESEKISNTTIPRVYESYWNKNLDKIIFRYTKSDSDEIINFYGDLKIVKTGTSSENTTKYDVKGRFMSREITNIAVSPKKDKVFLFEERSSGGTGYISNFDESKKTKIFDTPLTQVYTDWPEENTLTFTTKPSRSSYGYMYGFDIKTGSIKKILSGTNGFNAKLSRDAKKILYSLSSNNSIKTYIYDIQKNKTSEVIFNTLVDKCVWSEIRKSEVFCSVPNSVASGIYPDDWYRGKIGFIDQIWHLDTDTGEVKLLSNPLNQVKERIDAIDLTLDPKENYLYFINKLDLSLWVLDISN